MTTCTGSRIAASPTHPLTLNLCTAVLFGAGLISTASVCAQEAEFAPKASDNNHMSGMLYFDLGATFKASDKILAYAKINNLADRNPPLSPIPNSGLFDVLGRMYQAGVRFTF